MNFLLWVEKVIKPWFRPHFIDIFVTADSPQYQSCYGPWPGVKNPPVMPETQVLSLGQEDPLEKEMATLSRILALRIPMDRGARQATAHGVTQR